MTDKTELLSCPFCKRPAERIRDIAFNGIKARCTDPDGNCPGFNINCHPNEWNIRSDKIELSGNPEQLPTDDMRAKQALNYISSLKNLLEANGYKPFPDDTFDTIRQALQSSIATKEEVLPDKVIEEAGKKMKSFMDMGMYFAANEAEVYETIASIGHKFIEEELEKQL